MEAVFYEADVLAHKGQGMEAALETGGDLGRVPGSDLTNKQIGGYDHGLAGQKPFIEQVIQGGGDEIAGKLCAQIVNN